MASVQALTVASGKGTYHPSCKFTGTGRTYGGTPWNVSGTFSSELYGTETHAFAADIVEKYQNCEEELNVSLVRVSADQ